MTRGVLLIVFCAVFLSGCGLDRYTSQSGISGTVVNSKDRTPIAGATVTLMSGVGTGSKERFLTATDVSGHFEITTQRCCPTYGMEMFPAFCSLRIAAPGFKSVSLPLCAVPTSSAMAEFNVALERRGEEPNNALERERG
jgi:hypothetical protein